VCEDMIFINFNKNRFNFVSVIITFFVYQL